jgi:hypothetical protein
MEPSRKERPKPEIKSVDFKPMEETECLGIAGAQNRSNSAPNEQTNNNFISINLIKAGQTSLDSLLRHSFKYYVIYFPQSVGRYR